MNDLGSQLRAVADSPPPTRLDLDRLIEGESRRSRRMRWAGSGAAATVIALAAVLTAGMLNTAPSVDLQPGAPRDPLTSAEAEPVLKQLPPGFDVGSELPRLDAAVQTAWARVEAPPIGDRGLFTREPDNRLQVSAGVTVGPQTNELRVMLWLAPLPQEQQCEKNGPDISCLRVTEPDGSVTYRSQGPGQSGDDPVTYRQVEHYRPDGTLVMAVLISHDGEPLLSYEQLLLIATEPTLTLHP